VQAFDQQTADSLDFDVLDASKLIPEEIVPLTAIGKMTLDRNPDNFFAETEQVAFCPSHMVPGLDFTNDPLLQGRLHSYLDTQLSRLGGPNFHQIPVNAPKCPMLNFQRDALMQTQVPKGRVAYEPSSLDTQGPRECPERGFSTYPSHEEGDKLRIRAESFADHYSQARLFWVSMTPPEQRHLVNGFAFELGKCTNLGVRTRMLGHLQNVHADLQNQVANALGMEGEADTIEPAAAPVDLDPSPTLSIIGKAQETIKGRKIGMLLGDGADDKLLDNLKQAAQTEGAMVEIVAPKVGGITTKGGKKIAANHAVSGAPSVLFDAVVIAASEQGMKDLVAEAAAVNWVRDAFAHLKIIGHVHAALPLFEKASVNVAADEGTLSVEGDGGIKNYIAAAKKGRIWHREPAVESPG